MTRALEVIALVLVIVFIGLPLVVVVTMCFLAEVLRPTDGWPTDDDPERLA